MTATQSRKYYPTTLILCFFFGTLGIHRFYVGKIGTGLLMLVTGGGFGIWYLIDLFMIVFGKFRDKKDLFISHQVVAS